VSNPGTVPTIADDMSPHSPRPLALLVEDEVIFRLGVESILDEAGYDVVEAGTVAEALPHLDGGREVVLLLTDVRMPGAQDGFALARLASERHPSLAIVVVSAAVTPRPGDMPEGATFLEKPFTSRRLDAAIAGSRAARGGSRPA